MHFQVTGAGRLILNAVSSPSCKKIIKEVVFFISFICSFEVLLLYTQFANNYNLKEYFDLHSQEVWPAGLLLH